MRPKGGFALRPAVAPPAHGGELRGTVRCASSEAQPAPRAVSNDPETSAAAVELRH